MIQTTATKLPSRASTFLKDQISRSHLDSFYDEHSGLFQYSFVPDNSVQGPPGHAHGGFIATLLDEAMGACAWLDGHTVLAVRLNVTYRSVVPLGHKHFVDASIGRQEGRRIYVNSSLYGTDKKVCARGTGVYIKVDMRRLEEQPVEFSQYTDFQRLLSQGMSLKEAIAHLNET